MARTLTIRIKSVGDAAEGFRGTFKAYEAGRRVSRREGVYFTSIEAARNLLTRNRLALLRTIRTQRPGSIYELAKALKRDLKNVQEDLRILEKYGLVRMTEGRSTGKRRVKVPLTGLRAIWYTIGHPTKRGPGAAAPHFRRRLRGAHVTNAKAFVPDSRIRFTGPGLIRDRIVDALREAIVAGRLKPGERIRERELVALLGVSRSPLREAIRILEAEGLITSLPHRGAWVTELSASDLHDLVHVRVILETFAARLALERLDEATQRALEEQVRRSRSAGRKVDATTNFTLALEFHDLLIVACGNRKVIQLHEGLKQHQRRYQHFAFSRLGRDTRAVEEHAEIVNALHRRDIVAVERSLRTHLLRFYEEIAPLLPVESRTTGS